MAICVEPILAYACKSEREEEARESTPSLKTAMVKFFVKLIEGKTITVKAKASDTIDKIRHRLAMGPIRCDCGKVMGSAQFRLNATNRIINGAELVSDFEGMTLREALTTVVEDTMRITVVLEDCRIRMEVKKSDKIAFIKECAGPAFEDESYVATFGGQTLSNERTLGSYGIQGEATLYIVQEEEEVAEDESPPDNFRGAQVMQIFVKKKKKSVSLVVEESGTVRCVRDWAQYGLDMCIESECLVFNGRVLKVGHTLAEYEVENESTLHVVPISWTTS